MISLLIYILVLLIILGVIIYVVRLMPIQEPFKSAGLIIILLIFVLILLGIIGIIPGMAVRPLAFLDWTFLGNTA